MTSWANIRLSDDTQVGIGIDITERKRTEEMLREADRKKDEFLAVLAHELRNPLAPLRNAVRLLKSCATEDPDFVATRKMIERQVNHMVRLVDDLLDANRLMSGKISLKRKRISVNNVVLQALESVQPLIEAKGHRLDLALSEEEIFVDGDLTRLSQVVLNVLNNAAKYTQPFGSIRVEVKKRGPRAVISVKDNGAGIAKEHLANIFEMFAQEDSSLDRSEGGLGIGLNLSKQLLEMHDGQISAASDGKGKGSEFVIELPLVSHVKEEEFPEETVVMLEGFRILIADDNRDAADSLAMLLAAMGHRTHVAYNGAEAVSAAEEFSPDIVFLDIGMPILNGYEACKKIRSTEKGNKMVLCALSGWGQDEHQKHTSEAGFNFHLVKPVDDTGLAKVIEACGRNH